MCEWPGNGSSEKCELSGRLGDRVLHDSEPRGNKTESPRRDRKEWSFKGEETRKGGRHFSKDPAGDHLATSFF